MRAQFVRSIASAALTALVLAFTGCPDSRIVGEDAGHPDADAPEPVDGGPPAQRCDFPLERFLVPGSGTTRAKQMESAADFVGGPNAWAKVGDFLLANDQIKVAVQGPDRHISPNPFGGSIIDADLVRQGPGQDQFGEVGLFYNLSRTIDPDFTEVLSQGGEGEPAIVAISGRDTAQNYLRIKNIFSVPTLDTDRALPLKLTSYFILNPGEQRVRYVTAFCNEGTEDIVTVAGDLADPGWSVKLFNGQSCTGGFGYGGMCFGIDRMSWFGYQGDGVAYGYAPYRADSPYFPEATNAVMTIAGVTGILIGANGLSGVSSWLDPNATNRPGELKIPAGGARAIARDFVVGKDLGEVASLIETWRGALSNFKVGRFSGTVTRGGVPLAGARVSLQRDGDISAVFVTDAQGRYAGSLATGSYLASAWAPGSTPPPTVILQVAAEGEAKADFELVPPRRLTVEVSDAADGSPLPAKVVVACATSDCPATWASLVRFTDTVRDPIPDDVQRVDFVPVTGSATFEVPPGEYSVVVSRGPEWTLYPADYPTAPPAYVDLRTSDGSVQARLAHVVDSAGWASGDFHVHSVFSPDSYVTGPVRALSFAAEGVDVLVATDHDYVSDFRPDIVAIGAEKLLATVSGEEVSPVDFGHTNAYPIARDPSDPISGGAIDWGGGRGPTPSAAQIFAEARKKGATTIQINHPRGWPLGVLSDLKVDLDTFSTHADPKTFGMALPSDATTGDTKLISGDFNGYELLNGGTDGFDPYLAHGPFNDWFTMISRGMRIAAIGGSDAHTRFAAPAGYWRAWVKVPDDAPAKITPAAVSAAVNGLHTVVGDGFYVQAWAVRVGQDGTEKGERAGIGDVLAHSTDAMKVVVDIQAPPNIDVSKVELYMHLPSDDATCPVDPTSPEFKTTRVGCNGETNTNWPLTSITASQAVTLGEADKEQAFKVGETVYWRWHKQVSFDLPAPAGDNWIVAMVYGTKPLFPLVWGKNGAAVRPFAVTSPIFVDGDGNGWDKPPFNPPRRGGGGGGTAALPSSGSAEPPRALTPNEILERWSKVAKEGW
ncbi:MAG: CehA/McbA family metallohydrolase [Myxococcales bacterium]